MYRVVLRAFQINNLALYSFHIQRERDSKARTREPVPDRRAAWGSPQTQMHHLKHGRNGTTNSLYPNHLR
jgi:hypothetical protein